MRRDSILRCAAALAAVLIAGAAAIALQLQTSKVAKEDVEKAYAFMHDKNLFERAGTVSKQSVETVIDALRDLGDLGANFKIDGHHQYRGRIAHHQRPADRDAALVRRHPVADFRQAVAALGGAFHTRRTEARHRPRPDRRRGGGAVRLARAPDSAT